MMDKKDNWDEAARRLEEKTRNGEVEWKKAQLVFRDGVVGDIYETSINGKRLIIWEYRIQYSETEVGIEFVDHEGKVEWTWPEVSSRWTLLDSIRYQLVGGEQFLKQLLN